MNKSALHLMLALAAAAACPAAVTPTVKPPKAIVMIYADDLGYGDVGCYGAKGIATPSIDKLAEQGCRFTDAYSTTSVCTPSRYALFTGEYPWRKEGTGILPGDAALIIDTREAHPAQDAPIPRLQNLHDRQMAPGPGGKGEEN